MIGWNADSKVLRMQTLDGTNTVRFSDGTVIVSNNTHRIISKKGLVDITYDLAVAETAGQHAAGIPVAVTKGGLQTTASMNSPDHSTLIEIQYDTRVTATVNGWIRVRHRDGTLVVANDTGQVDYHPFTANTAEPSDALQGVYVFSCKSAAMEMFDKDQNAFHVQLPVQNEKMDMKTLSRLRPKRLCRTHELLSRSFLTAMERRWSF